jgi:hypothetical protein
MLGAFLALVSLAAVQLSTILLPLLAFLLLLLIQPPTLGALILLLPCQKPTIWKPQPFLRSTWGLVPTHVIIMIINARIVCRHFFFSLKEEKY